MIKKVMIVTTSVLVLFIIGGLMLSQSYEIKRSITIKTSAAKVHELLSDLNNWEKWDPWRAQDKGIQTEVLQASGLGASQKWQSQHGTGSLIVTQNDALRGMRYEISFDSSKYKTEAGFDYTPSLDSVVLTWYMRGEIKTPIIGGYVAYLSSQNTKMIDQGLSNIKALLEVE